jgi:hypothetical protein
LVFLHIEKYIKGALMGFLKKLVLIAGSTVALNLALTVINALQAGSRYPDGRTLKDILGKEASQATADDIEKLSRADCMQLFYAADMPDFQSFKGEFKALVLSKGVQGPLSVLLAHHVIPTGGITLKTRWEGKGFMPESLTSGYGYNLFNDTSSGSGKTVRIRKFRTYTGPTAIGKDGRNSIHLIYKDFNKGAVSSMHDEVRKVNDKLFICAGFLALGGGPANPVSFVLIGPPSEWIGLD